MAQHNPKSDLAIQLHTTTRRCVPDIGFKGAAPGSATELQELEGFPMTKDSGPDQSRGAIFLNVPSEDSAHSPPQGGRG